MVEHAPTGVVTKWLHRPRLKVASTGAAAVLINLHNTSSARVTVPGATRSQAWTLSPTPDGGPFGKVRKTPSGPRSWANFSLF
jgi:hypothetical protein